MKLIFFSFLLLFLSAQVMSNEINVVSVNDTGEEFVSSISQNNYFDVLKYELDETGDYLEKNIKLKQETKNGLKLKVAIVGIGAAGKIGIGPFSIGAAIHHRLFYKINN